MKAALILTLSLLSFFSQSQTKITITQNFQTVPKGKIWVLYPYPRSYGQKQIEFTKREQGLYQEFVNYKHLYHFVGFLMDIEPGASFSKKRLIVGDSLIRVPYANNITYSMNVMGAVNPKMISDFQEWLEKGIGMWGMCLEYVIFKEGTQVRVSDNIQSLQIDEYPAE